MKLTDPVSSIPLVGPSYQKKLAKLEIHTVSDLLLHVPNRYLDFSKTSKIKDVRAGEAITISGVVNSIVNQTTKKGRRMQIGQIEDETGKITVLWFNQPFLVRALYPGTTISLSGKLSWFAGRPALVSPEFEITKKGTPTTHTGNITGVYSETSGLSSKWLRSRVKMVLKSTDLSKLEFLPGEILKKHNLVKVDKALLDIHFPKSEKDSERALKRLAFNELLFLHIDSITKKKKWQKTTPSYKIKAKVNEIEEFKKSLPFKLTKSQILVIDEILADFKKSYPMNRLLQGDVGSGKTVVAALASYLIFKNGYKTVFMAPTQILAKQHFNSLNELFKNFGIKVELVTSGSKKAVSKLSDVLIGTHALIHRSVDMSKVGLVVIDEQHKFGVEQRSHLLKNNVSPHVLTMTATPIPRTIALTLYNDLELSILKEIPKGRQIVTTWLVPPKKRNGAHSWIDSEITKKGSQAFIICPLIDESEAETFKDVKSVIVEYEKLKNVFKSKNVGLLHGRMKEAEKHEVLQKFKDRSIDILVSTPVVEVGIDIPNATMMVIEDAKRFGLAQLHQLRGRVGRGKKKSYCILFSDKKTERLLAMTKTHSGFELSELDLKLRGPGEVFGLKQSGFRELKIASWTDTKLIKQTSVVAKEVLNNPLRGEKNWFKNKE
ncbi:ATP-dependent DNA helicase RecG [Candidatus Microgenomates bacterium]|nr:ATP-dependent DNA helicase RecG [Candidatus Microgenomates bacterium]